MSAMTEWREASEKTSARLLKSAIKKSYDPWVDIDWDAPLTDGAPYLPLHRTTLYGTELWDSMSPEQHVELSRHESASIASAGIWFETILMHLILRALYDLDPRTAHVQWAYTEIADECQHSIMFGKALERTGIPPYRHSKMFNELGRIFKTLTWGPSSYAAILVAEEILDEAQREMMKDEEIEPLVRRVSQIHVMEEARHITFAREQIALDMKAGLNPVDLVAQQTLCAVVAFCIVESLISPEVYKAVGLDTRTAVRAARNNPNLHATRADWGRDVIAFLHENDLIGGPAAGLWRACHLADDETYRRGLLGKGVDVGTKTALAAASTVLSNVPGLKGLARGTIAGVGGGPGMSPRS
jgi:hypothetical protein